MAVQKMQPEVEDKITADLSKMGELVNGGVHPTEALFKVATSQRVPAGHVRLMANAYNTGRTLHQMRGSDDLHEKLAEFPLADAAAVLERMYPSQVKTAAALFHGEAVSVDYELPPHWRVNRAKAAEKQAAAGKIDLVAEYRKIDGREEAPPGYGEDQWHTTKRAMDEKDKIEQQLDDMRMAWYGAGYEAVGSFDKLANYFRQSNALPLGAVYENAVMVYGDRAKAVLEKVSQDLGTLGGLMSVENLTAAYAEMDKQAAAVATPAIERPGSIFSTDPPPAPPPLPQRQIVKVGHQHDVNWARAPYSLITDCFAACERAIQAKQAYETFAKEASEKIAECLRPFVQGNGRSVITGSVWDAVSQTKEAASLLPFAAGGAVGGFAKGMGEKLMPDRQMMINKQVAKLEENDPQLQSIQTQTMLHDLMNNDPILSGYDPEQVVDAYNNISAVAPRAATHRLIAQALMRKYLEQATAVDTFDVDQLLGVEKKLIEQDPKNRVAQQPTTV